MLIVLLILSIIGVIALGVLAWYADKKKNKDNEQKGKG